MKLKGIPQSVLVLGLVSFLTDISSDMIYPLLPIFLTQYLGASQGFIGLIEGVAESTAAFFTLLSGIWADKTRDRGRLIFMGYSLSSLSRPLAAAAWTPWVVFFTRFFDRMGKGIRTSPRDALIADSVEAEHRGKAYGLHRSLDHSGAVLGPIIASLLLAGWVTNLRVLFALAAIPGMMAVLLIVWKVRDVRLRESPKPSVPVSLKLPSGKLRIYFGIYFLFILSCSSDAFLLLRSQELGVPPALLPLIWMTFNIVKAGTTYPFGILSDRIGRRRMLLSGWTVYSLIYLGFALATTASEAWALFAAYGLFYGMTEGSERAILVDYVNPEERGRVFGWHYFLVGMGALPASLLFGFLWQHFGSKTAFLTSAGLSTFAAFLLFWFTQKFPSAPKTAQRSS